MTQVDTASNNYMRPSTAAQVRAALNVEDGATAGGGFSATSATGTTPSLNVGNDTFFNHGKDTGNTTVSFTNVPTEASWKYSYQPAVISGAWDIDTRTIKDSMGFTSWETVPTGMHIDSTGTKLFIVGTGADGVNRFDLTVPWDPRSAVFHSESASFVNLDASFQDIFISPSGDEMFLIGDGGNAVHRWNMDVPFDVTDLSGRVTFGTGAQDTTVRGLTFSPDGTKMYVAGGQYNRIYHYTLSNAFSFSPQPAYQGYKTVPEGDPSAVFFKPDGTKMFVGGYTTDTVYAYDLSTAWDVTSASDDTSITIQNWQGNMSGLFFSPGGEYMYIIGNTGDRISRFSVGTLSTLTLPSSVEGVVTPVDPFARCTLEFVTLNGGTDVMLVNQSTIGLST
jgi:sugar lactone lactonase YvrE